LQEAGPRTELPDSVTDGLAELAARAEALADELEGGEGEAAGETTSGSGPVR
jgi:hypothetical protein